ncbi:hypothetical protein [Variovorax sp. OK605]|uniref:hypothetical protein n=1 Tax=Variovorax sp. OK605 TaxID=1855317 RepID=UPI001160DB52|nr:hypothetical protein [Variovorax sp. OK605]
MQKNEWASWVQAIFSVIAICAAVGIAMWQRRAEKAATVQRDLARAEIVASKVLLMTSGLPVQLERLASHIRSVPEAADPMQLLETMQAQFDFMPMPDEGQLMNLLPMPKKSARRLTHACELVDQSKLSIRKLKQIGLVRNLREMPEQFSALGDVVDRSVVLIEESRKDLDAFLHGRNAEVIAQS